MQRWPHILFTMLAMVAVIAGCPGGNDEDDEIGPDSVGGSNSSSGSTNSSSGDSSTPPPDTAKPLTPLERIQAALKTCTKPSPGLYLTDEDSEGDPVIPICENDKVVFWHADFDIDCDGKPGDICNEDNDPAFQPNTHAQSSMGEALDATLVPYVVIPSVSERFDYTKAGLEMGSVVLVIHGDKVAYGIIGDSGPEQIIGEASHKMATILGIDPDPATGGSSDLDILYVAFKGKESVVKKNEDVAEAETLGKARQAAVFPATP